jgi:hypothetical protein
MNVTEIGFVGVDCICLVQDRGQWNVLLTRYRNFRLYKTEHLLPN